MIYIIDRIEENVLVLIDEVGNVSNYVLNENELKDLELSEGDAISFDKGILKKEEEYKLQIEDKINKKIENIFID